LWLAFAGSPGRESLLLNVIDEEHDSAEADNIEVGAFEFPWREA
jgi:hypothetical protein